MCGAVCQRWGHLNSQETKVISSLVKKLTKKLNKEIVEIKLFGSKVKGNYSPDSDIDLFILIRKKTPSVGKTIDKIIFDYVFNYNLPFSPVIYDLFEFRKNMKLGSFFFENIQRDGINLCHI